jgi:hypothetical protein
VQQPDFFRLVSVAARLEELMCHFYLLKCTDFLLGLREQSDHFSVIGKR